MEELKMYYEAYKKAQAESNRLDELFEKHPEDEKIEAAWDLAYTKEYTQFGLLAGHIAKITGMSNEEARLVIMKKPQELEKLIAKIA